jgi:tRNA pseudouridine55 synthase
MLDGILNLDKPSGLTSHDVVAQVRAVAGQRRVGHAGTLDPLASGVLLVCLGRATRLVEYLMDSTKVYRARIRLGMTTDTYDATGTVLQERPVEVDRATVETALARFRGPVLQVPPMYSALKRDGQPLYRLARRGVTVERQPRAVEIYRLDLTAWEPPYLTVEVACSAGTYIRSLAHDLGERLGCGAYMDALTRLASGDFRIEEAIPLAALTRERLLASLLPPDAALRRYPVLRLDEAGVRAVRMGQTVVAPPQDAPLARAYAPDGSFVAVMEYQTEQAVWQPRKVF